MRSLSLFGLALLVLGCSGKTPEKSAESPSPAAASPTAPGLDASTPPAATAPADVLDRAAAVANPALDQAYGRWKQGLDHAQLPAKRSESWVVPADAKATGDATSGWTIAWSDHPPAGYEFDVTVTVSPAGDLKVTEAKATYATE